MNRIILANIFLCWLCVGSLASAESMEIVNQWGFVNFDFPYDYDLINMFRPENVVITGFELGYDKIFVSMPRLRAGVPATLAAIPRHSPPHSSPTLQAYPSWEYHAAGKGDLNCTGFMSVYRMRKDSCGRLWVLDSGVMTSIDNFQRVCNPKIVIIDIRTNQPVRTVQFPKEVQRPASLFTNIVIDESVQGSCDHAVAYISDTAAPGIVVYDSLKDTAWRFQHPTMYPDPDFSTYNIQGDSFTLMDGIVGLAHSPKRALLYFQPLATDRLFSIPTAVLRGGPLAEFEELPVSLVGRKSSQGLGLTVDPRDDSIYFSPLSETSIASWQPITNQHRIVATDPVALQFVAEIRYADLDGGNIWALSTRFQKFFKREANPHETNLRLIRFSRGNPFHSFGFTFGNNTLFLK